MSFLKTLSLKDRRRLRTIVKKTNINLNPLSIIDPYGPLSGQGGHFGITTSQVRKVTDPKKRRQFKRQLKKKHRNLRKDIKDKARADIKMRKYRDDLVKEHYKHYAYK